MVLLDILEGSIELGVTCGEKLLDRGQSDDLVCEGVKGVVGVVDVFRVAKIP